MSKVFTVFDKSTETKVMVRANTKGEVVAFLKTNFVIEVATPDDIIELGKKNGLDMVDCGKSVADAGLNDTSNGAGNDTQGGAVGGGNEATGLPVSPVEPSDAAPEANTGVPGTPAHEEQPAQQDIDQQ